MEGVLLFLRAVVFQPSSRLLQHPNYTFQLLLNPRVLARCQLRAMNLPMARFVAVVTYVSRRCALLPSPRKLRLAPRLPTMPRHTQTSTQHTHTRIYTRTHTHTSSYEHGRGSRARSAAPPKCCTRLLLSSRFRRLHAHGTSKHVSRPPAARVPRGLAPSPAV